eukprot:170421-Chlamydomonas_euryale.AAC.1
MFARQSVARPQGTPAGRPGCPLPMRRPCTPLNRGQRSLFVYGPTGDGPLYTSSCPPFQDTVILSLFCVHGMSAARPQPLRWQTAASRMPR